TDSTMPTHALSRRFPALERLPRLELATLPTPVTACAALSRALRTQVMCKRDDQTSAIYGGNKVRKLEFLLGDARAKGCDALSTVGAFGSHHVLASTIHGRALGFEVHAVLLPQPWTSHVAENLRADLAAGAVLHRATGYASAVAQMAT